MLRPQLHGLHQRVMGEENEYGLSISGGMVTLGKESIYSPENYVTRQLMGGSAKRWLDDGSGWYIDLNDHPEFTTYEALNGKSVAACSRNGDQLFVDMLQDLKKSHKKFFARRKVRLVRNNRDDRGVSYGCHSNFQCLRRVTDEQLLACLLTFEVTQILLFGAGYTFVNMRGKLRYALSQRAGRMERIFSIDSTAHRPIINARDEPLANRSSYRRLHLINGDSNILWTPSWLKYDLRALLLLMIECDSLPAYSLDNPVAALHEINNNWRARVRGIQGLRSATAIQAWYLERAKLFVDRHELRQFDEAIDTWSQLVQAFLKQDMDGLVGEVDWVTKGRIQDMRQAKWDIAYLDDRPYPERDHPRIIAEDREYHTLLGVASSAWAVRQKFDPDDIDERLEAAKSPPRTRAAVRAKAKSLADEFDLTFTTDWQDVTLRHLETIVFQVRLSEPTETNCAKLNRFEKSLRHRAR